MAVANCPACGGPIEFKIGSSVVLVCDHCNSIVARTDRGLEDLGKVAALVDTGSPLRRDLTGSIRGAGFRIVGRTQMKHPMGGVWDEWYAAFDNGGWAWVAEAQGKYYLTVKTQKTGLPPYNVLQIGGMLDGMKVVELATATVISGEGEIPFRVVPGDTYEYADLSGEGHRFGTIDYSEDPPLLFEGEETTLAGLGISIDLEPPRQTPRVAITNLNCSQCGGPLTLVAPDQAERVICPHCGAAHDVEEGNLRYLETLKRRGPQPLVPLGTKGKIKDQEYVVAGYMQRSVTFDQKYYWTEYLLFATRTKSFAWLVDDDGHWSYVLPLSAGDLQDSEPAGPSTTVTWNGTLFRIFQDAVATVESVIGEFYWKVSVGEQARGIDYIAPPMGVSKEISDTGGSHEVNYSLAEYITPDAIEAAFGVQGLPRPTKLGTLQPATAGGCALGGVWALLVVLLLVVTAVVGIVHSGGTALSQSYSLGQYAGANAGGTPASPSTTSSETTTTQTSTSSTQPSGNDWSGGTQPANDSGDSEASAVVFSKPFTLKDKRIIEIKASAPLTNNWIGIGGDLYNEQTGLLQPFELKFEHYEGVEDGESWSEGSTSDSVELPPVPAGTYALRIEAHWDGKQPPPDLNVEVDQTGIGATGGVYLVLAFIIITIPALLSLRGGKEGERWADSMYTPGGQLRDDD